MRSTISAVSSRADPDEDHGPEPDLTEQLVRRSARCAGHALHDEAHPGRGATALGTGSAAAAAVTGPASSPSRGGPSAASVKVARAFQIIQPFAPLSAAAAISASTWSAV